MEVKSSEWQSKAVNHITKYLHRGGHCKGVCDDPQLIGASDFLNTIGIAMGLPTSNPENWTEAQLEEALKEQMASEKVFRDIKALKLNFENVLNIVLNNDVVGAVVFNSDLSDAALVAAIKKETIKFGSKISAAYHSIKHPTKPLDAYISHANEIIRSSTSDYVVTLGQDGEA